MLNMINFDLSAVLGKNLEEANTIAKEAGFTTRLISVDGKSMIMEADLRRDRINLSITGTRVTGASIS